MTDRPSPQFSFAMPAYNAADVIARAIESVLAQDVLDWELVIVNDGSTDDTQAIIALYAASDDRIRIATQPNGGCGAARDHAARLARAPWIVRLDADDELFPNYLSAMRAFMERSPGYDIYSCNGIHVYPDGSTRLARPGAFYEEERSFTFDEMLFATHIFTVALFSKDLYARVGGISHEAYCEDLEFWLRALSLGATHRYTPQALAYYGVSDTQMTADFAKVVASRVKIYSGYLDSPDLTGEQKQKVRHAIEKVQDDLWIHQKRQRTMARVQRLFGPRVARGFSAMVHMLGKPVRALIAAMRPKGNDR